MKKRIHIPLNWFEWLTVFVILAAGSLSEIDGWLRVIVPLAMVLLCGAGRFGGAMKEIGQMIEHREDIQ